MQIDQQYLNWISDLKNKIRNIQIKASIAINEQMIILYWEIGKSIVEKQQEFNWGSKIVEQMAKDLKRDLPETNGFSRTNLFAMRKFYLFYKDSELSLQQGEQSDNNKNVQNLNLVHLDGGQFNKKETEQNPIPEPNWVIFKNNYQEVEGSAITSVIWTVVGFESLTPR